MITIITGLPGAGKTLYAITTIQALAAKEKRPVFYARIKGLKLAWTEVDPEDWMQCPPGSIIVIDEAQGVFPLRSPSVKAPPHVADLATHRHNGVDIFLITQHPMLLDGFVRRLAGQHFHVVRAFGAKAATVHEWGSVRENCDKNRTDSTKHPFKYPKANFALYHSAEVHTHKVRIPPRLLFLLAVPFILAAIGYRFYSSWQAKQNPPKPAITAPGSQFMSVGAQGGQNKPTLTQAQYLAQFSPRINGLAYTAPVYDEVTRPQQAPYPAACVKMLSRGCGCYTQQGTKLDTTKELCEGIVAGGFFVAWDKPLASAVPAQPASLAARVQAEPVLTGHASLGGSSRSHILQDKSSASDQYDSSGGAGGGSAPSRAASGRRVPLQ